MWIVRTLLAILVAVTIAQPAHAQSRDPDAEAHALYLRAEFRAAASAFDAILERSDLDVARAVEAHRYLAALRSLLGDPARARAHALAATALDPDAAPPEGASEETLALFDEARRTLAGRPAVLRVDAPARASRAAAARARARIVPPVALVADVLDLACVERPGASARRATGRAPEVTVALPGARPRSVLSCTASARTEAGATLLRTEVHLTLPDDPSRARADSPGDRDEGSSVPWAWIVAGGVVIAAGAVLAAVLIASQSDEAELHGPQIEGWP